MSKASYSRWHFILPLIGFGIFCLAIWVLVREVHHISMADVIAEINAISPSVFALSIFLAFVGYAVLTLYDVLALRYVGDKIAYRKVAPVSYSAFAIGHNVGLASLSGGAIRYRAYSLAGVSATRIAILVGFIPLTYFLGGSLLMGITVLTDPAALKVLPLSPPILSALGWLLVALPLLYVVMNVVRREPITVKNWIIRPPGPSISVRQCLLGCLDLTVASLPLFVVLHAFTDISFLHCLGVYVLAMLVGVVSNVPGGVGVFESALILLLPELPVATVLGAALTYRLVYYLIPLMLALLLVVAHEGIENRKRLISLSSASVSWGARLVPPTIGTVVFLVGAYLTIGAAIPLEYFWGSAVNSAIPLPLLEMSHLTSSAIGLGLLLLARGLFRRLQGAHRATIALLVLGAISIFLHRDSALQAALLLALALLMWTARAEFYRGRSLREQLLDWVWVLNITAVLALGIALGMFVHRHVEYSDQLWWEFTVSSDASRWLRASLLMIILAGAYAGLRLLRGRPSIEATYDEEQLAQIDPIVKASTNSNANLALLGDKQFLVHPQGEAAIMYQLSGRSYISMGDPLGNPEHFNELVWNFRELCDRRSVHCAFYEVGEKYLPLYVDLGLSLSKLGEEALVDLVEFNLSGKKRAKLRNAVSRSGREGAEFAIVPAAGVPTIYDELQRVSDEWLADKNAQEKGFSLGFFDRDYMLNFDCAVMRVEGQLVAFSNLWSSADLQELAIDLMRFSQAAPYGTMDAMFAQIMLWGHEQGYKTFSLGMAPLSGLDNRSLAPAWNKLGNAIYRTGEHFYNFEGLRVYKQKYHPQWSPRYLACRGGFELPGVLLDTTALISGGVKGLLTRK
ncbi:MAG: bifunctional lysylphosphatidylglycerol flippase/synthetase MprF [Pseudomonadota bacterium]